MNENPNQPALWPKDELKMFLMAYDIEVDDFEYDELVAFAMSLIGNNDNDKSFESDFASPPPQVRSPIMTDIQQTNMDEINRFLDIPEQTSNIINRVESLDDSFDNANDFDDSKILNNIDSNNNSNNPKIDNHKEITTTFCEITSCELKSAEYYLEAYNYDLNGAIAFYMEQNENKSPFPPPASNSINDNKFHPPSTNTNINSNDINWNSTTNDVNDLLNNMNINKTPSSNLRNNSAVPIRKKKQQSYTGFSHSQMREIRALESNNYIDDDDDDEFDFGTFNRIKKVDEFDENGIRRPDSVKKERLLGGGVDRFHSNRVMEEIYNPLDRADAAGN
jgi:hypothetical protein